MANGTPETATSGSIPNSPQVGYSVCWYGASNKIGLPNYSNVDVGPAGCQIVVEAGKEKEGIEYCAAVANSVLFTMREKVLEQVKKAHS